MRHETSKPFRGEPDPNAAGDAPGGVADVPGEATARTGSPAKALFVREGDVFHPTGLTRSFWSDSTQHGGPPTGLLGRAVETVPTPVPMQVVRLTVDLFREVPIDSPLTVSSRVVRDGRRIQVVEAALLAAGTVVARASGLKIRTVDVPLPPLETDWTPPPGPDLLEPVTLGRYGFEKTERERFHSHSVEIRTVNDSFFTLGEGLSWFRLAVPLVAGEPTSPFQRAATLSDMGNGNSMALDGRRWFYANADVTLSLHRPPGGAWLGMRSFAHQHPAGVGFSDTELFDESGPVGRVGQCQIVEPRGDSPTT